MQLRQNDVELVVVGLTAAVLQGAPLVPQSIEVVHRHTRENVARLGRTLSGRACNWSVDCLEAVGDGLRYEELEPNAITIALSDGLHCRVLALDRLIDLNRGSGRKQDLAVLPVLEATLDELQKRR
jgi:hypothetical protein